VVVVEAVQVNHQVVVQALIQIQQQVTHQALLEKTAQAILEMVVEVEPVAAEQMEEQVVQELQVMQVDSAVSQDLTRYPLEVRKTTVLV
jgi:DNA-binding TFAR19-related protein (PDSD5 family)